MSTNIYAKVRWNGNITQTFHLGKTRNDALVTLDGNYFRTKDAWRTFLKHNAGIIDIVDDYGFEQTVEGFLETTWKFDVKKHKDTMNRYHKDAIGKSWEDGVRMWEEDDVLFLNGEWF